MIDLKTAVIKRKFHTDESDKKVGEGFDSLVLLG